MTGSPESGWMTAQEGLACLSRMFSVDADSFNFLRAAHNIELTDSRPKQCSGAQEYVKSGLSMF